MLSLGIPGWWCGDMDKRGNAPLSALMDKWPGSRPLHTVFLDWGFLLCQSASHDWSHFVHIPTWEVGTVLFPFRTKDVEA